MDQLFSSDISLYGSNVNTKIFPFKQIEQRISTDAKDFTFSVSENNKPIYISTINTNVKLPLNQPAYTQFNK